MKHIYCLSGLGADERVFSRLNFDGYQTHHLPWVIPEKSESLSDYAGRLIQNIHHSSPILIGLSFGGMICIEIAKQIPVEKIILISSIQTTTDIPLWMRIAAGLKLNRIFPMRSFAFIEPLENYNLGLETKEERAMVHSYRKNVSRQYTEWAIDNLLNWKNKSVPSNLYHIHGDKDRIFPVKNLKPHYIVATGGHFMVMNRFTRVNEYIKVILELRVENGELRKW